LAAAYDWRDWRTVIDVGGGEGALIAAILVAAPWLRGVLFDLPMSSTGLTSFCGMPVWPIAAKW
jgi:hypothetical protein